MQPNAHPSVTTRPIHAAQTHALRHAVLRPHQTLAAMVYDADDAPGTIHLGAFRESDAAAPQLIGIVTLNDAPLPDQPAEGDVRLRGMAVVPEAQGGGVGRALVDHAIRYAEDRGKRRLWCNARVSAMGFYARLGFQAHGTPFDIPRIGPHDVMSIALRRSSR